MAAMGAAVAGRRLSAEEQALWRRVMATVRPIKPEAAGSVPALAPVPTAVVTQPPLPTPGTRPAPAKRKPGPGMTLDASWDRKLATGAVAPDCSIDLHGHTLDTAYHLLDSTLDAAIRRGDRLLLLVTGRPPRPESERPHARGRIRAAVGDWLAASRHANRIAAVRAAHPRHGGAGALYIVLRRDRSAPKY